MQRIMITSTNPTATHPNVNMIKNTHLDIHCGVIVCLHICGSSVFFKQLVTTSPLTKKAPHNCNKHTFMHPLKINTPRKQPAPRTTVPSPQYSDHAFRGTPEP